MLAASGSETVREPEKVLFMNCVEHLRQRPLDDLVFQRVNSQRALPPIQLGNVVPPRWSRPISTAMQARMQLNQVRFPVTRILVPRHAVCTRCRIVLQPAICSVEQIDRDVVHQRGEPFLLTLSCSCSYTFEPLGHARPAQSPARALLARVPLGPLPWLHGLRPRLPAFVRPLHCYYEEV